MVAPTVFEPFETEELLRDLGGSPTDLAKLVTRIQQRPRRVVAISGKAIERWHRDDPHAWERARAWLTKHDVRIIVN